MIRKLKRSSIELLESRLRIGIWRLRESRKLLEVRLLLLNGSGHI